MNLTDYTQAAIKTESVIESINTNKARLVEILCILINAGNMLDDLKKNIFYNRPIHNEKYSNSYISLLDHVKKLKDQHVYDQNDYDSEDLKIDTRVFHGIIGMSTESTELLEALLKYIETGELDTVNTAEECGDNDWYEAILLDALDQDWGLNMQKNIDKLKLRYESKFSNEKANNRNLESERALLENA